MRGSSRQLTVCCVSCGCLLMMQCVRLCECISAGALLRAQSYARETRVAAYWDHGRKRQQPLSCALTTAERTG